MSSQNVKKSDDNESTYSFQSSVGSLKSKTASLAKAILRRNLTPRDAAATLKDPSAKALEAKNRSEARATYFALK